MFDQPNLRHVVVPQGPLILSRRDGEQESAILMMLVDGGGLDTAMIRRRQKCELFSVEEAASVMAQTIIGLRESGLVHRDIKPANLLIHHDRIHVSDWDLAVRPGYLSTVIVGTAPYLAPESAKLSQIPASEKVDVYAIGFVGYELVSGKAGRDWPNMKRGKYLAAVERDSAPRETGDHYFDLVLSNSIKRDPLKRSSSLDMLADLCAYGAAREHLNLHDRKAVANRLLERSSSGVSRDCELDRYPMMSLLNEWKGEPIVGDRLSSALKQLPASTLLQREQPRSDISRASRRTVAAPRPNSSTASIPGDAANAADSTD